MTDTTLLDGNVDEVKKGLTGLDAKHLTELLATEQAGKARKAVISAIEEAQTSASTNAVTYSSDTDRGDGQTTTSTDAGKGGGLVDGEAARAAVDGTAPSVAVSTAASLDRSPPADIAPATEFDPAGAPVQSSGFDLDHAALDANPRANTTEDQNRIDFNDPVRTGEEIVTARLKDQAKA